MAQLPDVYGWIKVISNTTGKAQPNPVSLDAPATVIVRYSFANDSHKAAGPLWVVGKLYRDGVKLTPNGQSNVVPSQQVTVQPGQVWSKEYSVSESDNANYKASLSADVANLVDEEDEKNNFATAEFSFLKLTS